MRPAGKIANVALCKSRRVARASSGPRPYRENGEGPAIPATHGHLQDHVQEIREGPALCTCPGSCPIALDSGNPATVFWAEPRRDLEARTPRPFRIGLTAPSSIISIPAASNAGDQLDERVGHCPEPSLSLASIR